MTLTWVKLYMKESRLHLDKLEAENCLMIRLHLSAVNLHQVSVVFPLANLVPFQLALQCLGLQPLQVTTGVAVQ